LAGTVSGFGFVLTLGFTPGQVLGLLTLALLAAGTLTTRGTWRAPGYTPTIALPTSYLLVWVFFTPEALKHFPADRPVSPGPAPPDPALIPVRLGLLAVYLAVLGTQLWKSHAARLPAARLDRVVAAYRHAA